VNERTREGFVNYDSLQLTANRRFTGGVAFGTAYTLSTTKGMQGTLPTFLDPRSRLFTYENSDRRHILSFQGSWNIPDGSRFWGNTVGRALLDGWQVAGVGYWRSGTPSTVTFTTTDAGGTDTMGGGDPVFVSIASGCDPILSRGDRSENQWFDTGCFFRTPRGDVGNAMRNIVRQPGNQNLDLSMSKSFAVNSRGHRLQFRVDAYNALSLSSRTVNTTAQFDPQGNQINAEFGRLGLPTDEARQIELSFKYTF
jgi:hypothetical protein